MAQIKIWEGRDGVLINYHPLTNMIYITTWTLATQYSLSEFLKYLEIPKEAILKAYEEMDKGNNNG
jgi:hypothetical protein